MSYISKHLFLQYILFVIFSLLYLFIASPYTSPSNPYYNCDSAIFYTIGNSINAGLLPFRDLFDHKGPLLFYIYALGTYLIDGKAGVFLLQSFAFGLSLLLLYKLSRLFFKQLISGGILILALAVFPACIGEGALSEEWSLPLSLLPLYLVVREMINHPFAKSLSLRYWLLIGVSLGLHAMIRLNNSAIVCGIILYFVWELLKNKRLKELFMAATVVVLGVTLAMLPFVLYFCAKGALYDMVYGTFIHNIERALYGGSSKTTDFWITWSLKTMAFPITLIAGAMLVSRQKLDKRLYILFSIVSATTAISLIAGSSFPHYYLNFIPCILIAILLLIKLGWGWISNCTGCSLLVFPYIHGAFNLILCGMICFFFPGHPTEKQLQLESAAEFNKIVTEKSIGDVLAIDTFADMYLYMGCLPPFKYFILQSTHAQISKDVTTQLNSLFRSEKSPAFVILNYHPEGKHSELESIEYKDVKSALNTKYERVAQGKTRGNDATYSLYKKMEQ